MQKVLISALAYDGGKSGIANYIEHTVKALSQYLHIDLIVNEKEKHFFEGISENISFRTVPSLYQKPLQNMLWHMFVLPIMIRKDSYDWMLLPAGNRRLMAYYPVKTLVTMHDLSQFHVAKKYDAFRMTYIKKVIPFFLKRADKIMTVSGSTADDLESFYGMKRNELVVNHNGVNTTAYSPIKEGETITPVHNKPYLLYVARIEHPGKNHMNLIKAYEQLDASLKASYDLVLVGSDWNGAEEVHAYAEASEDRDRIKFKGFVANEALPDYYRQASLFVFPSFYEGFGIPVAEAMASGTPVVASCTSSLPEVGGDAARYFDPEYPEDIADTISIALNNKGESVKMRNEGLQQVKKFDWDLHAKKIIETASSAT